MHRSTRTVVNGCYADNLDWTYEEDSCPQKRGKGTSLMAKSTPVSRSMRILRASNSRIPEGR